MWNKTAVTLTKSAVFSLLALVIILSSCSGKEEAKPEAQKPSAELASLPDSLLILAGKQLFHSPALGTANKSCASCHIEGEDLKGVADSYPKFYDLAAKEVTLVEVNNICIEGALKGKPLDPESDAARALAAYIHSLK